MHLARLLPLVLLVSAFLAPAPAAAADRYSLVHGCYALAENAGVLEGGPFRMQATDLGSYLLYGKDRRFLSTAGLVAEPSPAADWKAEETAEPDRFKLTPLDGGAPRTFTFTAADGCAAYPEVEINASGEPHTGPVAHAPVRGYIDAHLHMMAFEFIGGRVRCGTPWHRYGVTHALVDCPDHEPGGAGAVLENILSYKTPVGTHDTVGWPTFRDWPAPRSLTHEQIYYRWLERAWRGGLRMFVNLFVDNAVLCEVYPYKKNSCNEMESVELQHKRLHELQDYIDAQSGGPGKGWFRIVRDPFEARRVINDGKLAVVMGIENSKLFNCGHYNDVPECTRESIDRDLAKYHAMGIRSLELVNKFDNALSGVAGDAGDTGLVVNSGNRYETGQFWDFKRCETDGHDHTQTTIPGYDRDVLVAGVLEQFLPRGALPLYEDGQAHCNTRGLTALGEHLIRRMMERGMIFDPDHMSVLARNQALSIVEAARYPGVVSSHSWSSPDALPRIAALGGVITPYAGGSQGFVRAWRETKAIRSDDYFWGIGYGADMNGFGGQGEPRGAGVPNPVRYPFTTPFGTVMDKQRSGERVYDLNVDGVSHYGLYPDWIEDLRMLAGDEIVEDMTRGPEAYLQMWERAIGVPSGSAAAVPARTRATRRGLAGIAVGDPAEDVLRAAGQPLRRGARVWRYRVAGRANRRARVTVVFDRRGRVALVASTARAHAARAGRGVVRGRGYVAVTRDAKRLRAHLRLAGLR